MDELYQKTKEDDIKNRVRIAIQEWGPSPSEIAETLGTDWREVRDYLVRQPDLVQLYKGLVDKIVESITVHNGNRKQIAAHLNCERSALRIWESSNERIREAFRDAQEGILDLAEEKLVTMLLREDNPNHYKSVELVLLTKGKDRGYNKTPKSTLRAESERLGLNVSEIRNKLADELAGQLEDKGDS